MTENERLDDMRLVVAEEADGSVRVALVPMTAYVDATARLGEWRLAGDEVVRRQLEWPDEPWKPVGDAAAEIVDKLRLVTVEPPPLPAWVDEETLTRLGVRGNRVLAVALMLAGLLVFDGDHLRVEALATAMVPARRLGPNKPGSWTGEWWGPTADPLD